MATITGYEEMCEFGMTLPKVSRTETALKKISASQPEFNRKLAATRLALAEMLLEDGDQAGYKRNVASAHRLLSKSA